jgi:hypothetical protein
MSKTTKYLLQLLPAALLIWVGWDGITAPSSALPGSLLKIPLFFFGIAWVVLVVVLVWREQRS